MKKIAKENLPKLFAEVSAAMDLFTPVKMADVTNWGLWDDSRVADLDTLKRSRARRMSFSRSARRFIWFTTMTMDLRSAR